MDPILDLFHSAVRALSHGDPLASAGVTMWLLTVCGVLLRRVPRALYWKIRAKFVVRMVMNKPGHDGPPTPEVRNFVEFLKWFDTLASSRFDRNRKPYFQSNGDVRFLPGYGFHWFWFGGRYYWFIMREIESQGINSQKEQITLFTFGMSLKPLENIIDQFKIVPDRNTLNIYSPDGSNVRSTWNLSGQIPIKDRPDPIVNADIQREVFDRVDEFFSSEQWYRERGLTYKTTYLLMGSPGTGKTSIARDIAIKHRLRLHDLSLSQLNDRSLRSALNSMKGGGMLLVDDFDDIKTLHHRTTEPEGRAPTGVSLSSFLGMLDGVIPLDNVIVVLVTNHPQRLDPAIYRPGRVDHKIVVGPLTEDRVCDYIARMYQQTYTGRVEATVVAVLSGIFNRNKHDYEGFCREYTEYLDGTLKLDELEYSGEVPTAEEARQPLMLEAEPPKED